MTLLSVFRRAKTPTVGGKREQRSDLPPRRIPARRLLLSLVVRSSLEAFTGDLVVDFETPASVASRYRAHLVSVSRAEAEICFLFSPSLFRTNGNQPCEAEISLVLGRSVVRASGLCRMDGGGRGTGARIRFTDPLALHDYALLRRVCGTETVAPEIDAPPLDLEPLEMQTPQTA